MQSTVESCETASETIDGSKIDGYHVILEDTVLFPEGGGQVCKFYLILLPYLLYCKVVFKQSCDGIYFTIFNVFFD